MSRRKSTHVPLKLSDEENANFNAMLARTEESDEEIKVLNTRFTEQFTVDAAGGTVSEQSSLGTPSRRSTRKRSPNKRYIPDNTNTRTPRKREVITVHDDDEDDDTGESEEETEDRGKQQAGSTLFEERTDVAGGGIYRFQTPKKRGSMSALAMASAHRTPRTPRTPSGTAMSRTICPKPPKTPMHVRRVTKKEISKALQACTMSDFSASESDYEPSSDDDEREIDYSSTEGEESPDGTEVKHAKEKRISVPVPKLSIPVPAKLQPQSGAPVRRSSRRAAGDKNPELQYIVSSDDYFTTHCATKSVTSDHTLDRLNTPRLAQDVLFRLLQETNTSRAHTDSMRELSDEHEQQFEKWMYQLDEGFSVLLYGLGSKRTLLQTFHQKVLAESSVLVVNGFFPGLTVKDVLDQLAGDLLELRHETTNHHETIDVIGRELACEPDLHIFLLVHNLDGVAMRNERMQSTICRLASIPNIHLIATIDHINAPLLWDATKLRLYNFCWCDTTTMLPYTVETAYENSLLVQNTGAPALSSMMSVFASLTANARGIFMAIVKHQLAHGGASNPQYAGMPLKELYWSCREAFLVSSDIALRAQLTEFIDHKLLRMKRTVDGSESLHIPIDHGLLQRFVDEAAEV